MKICLISYGDYDYDGRLRELMQVFSELGELHAFTRGSHPANARHTLYSGGYAGFIPAAVRYGAGLDGVDMLMLDNRKSIIPGLLMRRRVAPKILVLDCRELYRFEDVHHFAGKLGCVIERRGIQQADVLICANQERAALMKEWYHLAHTPLVYENLRQLHYSQPAAEQAAEKKFGPYLHQGELRLIATAGCSISRTTDVLVRNLKRVEGACRLFLVGSSSADDERAVRRMIAEEGLDNVEIFGQLGQDELKALIRSCHIGIVNYSQVDHNNRFCASGKLYEFLYEGLPVVTTTNPPLKRLCDTYGIGASDDAYADAINLVAKDYAEYRQRVQTFAAAHPVDLNNDVLCAELRKLCEVKGLK